MHHSNIFQNKNYKNYYWISIGIIKSLERKNEYFEKFIIIKDPLEKIRLYRNLVSTLRQTLVDTFKTTLMI